METHFREQLIDLWDGKLFQLREVVNYALDGSKLNLLLQFSVLPGREHDWSLVQVALTDITARKKAEAYLEYLGTHDVLTKLYNRSFYVDELNRLERKGPHPVTIIMADLNGLKNANDESGHAAGDALLRRAGEVLNSVVEKPAYACRIGGDEFAILLPETDEAAGRGDAPDHPGSDRDQQHLLSRSHAQPVDGGCHGAARANGWSSWSSAPISRCSPPSVSIISRPNTTGAGRTCCAPVEPTGSYRTKRGIGPRCGVTLSPRSRNTSST